MLILSKDKKSYNGLSKEISHLMKEVSQSEFDKLTGYFYNMTFPGMSTQENVDLIHSIHKGKDCTVLVVKK